MPSPLAGSKMDSILIHTDASSQVALIGLLALSVSIVLCPMLGFAHTMKTFETELQASAPSIQIVHVRAPSFTLYDAKGGDIRLVDLRGKVVILTFVPVLGTTRGSTACAQSSAEPKTRLVVLRDIHSEGAAVGEVASAYGLTSRRQTVTAVVDSKG
ncbi:MAG: hypothetical protein ACI8PT_000002 [Gammaproteobacteria bacterium]